MGRCVILFSLLLLACSENNKGDNKSVLNAEEADAAENAMLVNPNGVGIQYFRDLPADLKQCRGLFVTDTLATNKRYVFANDLKGKAYLMIGNKLVELHLIKQTNIDKKTVNELYTGEDLEVELKTTLNKELADNAWNHNGVLVIKKEGREEAINVTGKLGC